VEGLYGRRTFKSVTPPVYVVNEHDDTPFPEIFIYIDDLVLNDKVTPPDPDFLVGCDCDDKCLHVRGKKFCHEDSAYTNRGKLQENYTGAIYECNFSCKCDPETCPNRVVQRGRQVPLEIFKTARKGWGVRSTKRIKKNTFVEEYLGEVITEGEGALRGKLYDRIGLSYLFDMDLAGVDEYQKYVIDSYVCGNSSHFFNHSCNPNLVVYGVFHDSMDVSFHRLAFFANRDIEPNEELTFDYTGISQDDDDTKSKKFPCHCDADTCRHWIHL
jgi:histone-lysine N-methyltransferase SUV39H